MKYCKDCRFYCEAGAVSFFGAGFAWPEICRSPGLQPWPRSFISGEIIQGWGNPLEQRNDESACGMEGKWFQLKPIEPDKIQSIAEVPSTIVMLDKPIYPAGYGIVYPKKTPWWKLW